jgi:hypothetical protein
MVLWTLKGITYARNLLNFGKILEEYTFTDKHRESENLMHGWYYRRWC